MKTVKDRFRPLDQLKAPDVWARAKSLEPGPDLDVEPSAVPRSGRLVAAVVALAVFLAAGVFAWRSLQPGPVTPSVGDATAPASVRGASVPPFVVQVFDRATAPPIKSTTESYASGHSPHVLDLMYGSDVGRWRPTFVGKHPSSPLEGGTTPFLYPDTDPVLNAGAPVQFSSEAASTSMSLTPIARSFPYRRTGPPIPLTDGGSLPSAGHYFFLVRAKEGGTIEEWRTNFWILPPGTLQLLWFNDGSGPHGEPVIAMAVNGEYLKCGTLDATGIVGASASPTPLPDAVPPQSRALSVASGARIAFLEAGYSDSPGGTAASLSYADQTPPYDEIGSVDFQDAGQVVAAPPGEYLFRWHVEVHKIFVASKEHDGFHGDLVCPINITEPVRD